MDLPEMTDEVRENWKSTGNVRTPLTLKSPEPDEPIQGENDVDDDDQTN